MVFVFLGIKLSGGLVGLIRLRRGWGWDWEGSVGAGRWCQEWAEGVGEGFWDPGAGHPVHVHSHRMDKSETGHGTEVAPADVEGWRNLSYRWAASESAAQELKREEKIERLPAVGNCCGANVWAVASETYAEPSGKHVF